MSLSCSCDWDDGDPDWYWWPPKDYWTYGRAIGKRCCCERCNNIVHKGDTCGQVLRTRQGTEWEHDHGIADEDDPESVNLASAFMCEKCVDLFFSFEELGFECVSPYEDMRGLAKEYHDLYQPTKKANPKAGP